MYDCLQYDVLSTYLHHLTYVLEAESNGVVLERHDDPLSARRPRIAGVVVHHDAEVVPWQSLLNQCVGAVPLERVVCALEGDVVGVSNHCTGACNGNPTAIHRSFALRTRRLAKDLRTNNFNVLNQNPHYLQTKITSLISNPFSCSVCTTRA